MDAQVQRKKGGRGQNSLKEPLKHWQTFMLPNGMFISCLEAGQSHDDGPEDHVAFPDLSARWRSVPWSWQVLPGVCETNDEAHHA